MDSGKRKIYLEASTLYQSGNTEEARKLWESLLPKSTVVATDPLIWRIVSKLKISKMNIFYLAVVLMMVAYTFIFGRGSAALYYAFGDLLYFKSNIEIYRSLQLQSVIETQYISFLYDISDSTIANQFDQIIILINQYIVSKIFFIQNILLLRIESLLGNGTFFISGYFYYLLSFVGSITLFIAGVVVDIYFLSVLFVWVKRWLDYIFSKIEIFIRFICVISIFLMIMMFIYFINTVYAKENKFIFEKPTIVEKDLLPVEPPQEQTSIKVEEKEITEKEYYEIRKKRLLEDDPTSMAERVKKIEMKKDLFKLQKKYGIRSKERLSATNTIKAQDEMLKMLEKGNIEEIVKMLKSKKSKDEIQRRAQSNGLSKKDKEFTNVFEKVFKSGDKSDMQEFKKLTKELEEMYGMSIRKKALSKQDEKRLFEEFKKDREKAKKQMRRTFKSTLNNQLEIGRAAIEIDNKKIEIEMNAIINYLEGGGDIRKFNRMRTLFLNKYKDSKVRFMFSNKVIFLIASWNEHQVKYFWQINREIMMDIILMVEESYKSLGEDIRGASIGWLYLVAGYYEEARKECLRSAEFNEAKFKMYGLNKIAFTNRSNAALAALMLGKGQVAFHEYRFIYQKVLGKKGTDSRLEESYLIEFIRELTAVLASSKPCIEAFACRAFFLEGISDELALKDLKTYLVFNTKEKKINQYVAIKIKLLKKRIKSKK